MLLCIVIVDYFPPLYSLSLCEYILFTILLSMGKWIISRCLLLKTMLLHRGFIKQTIQYNTTMINTDHDTFVKSCTEFTPRVNSNINSEP